ncbi:MAG TPA: YdeI/OmpD-associated family protein [Bacillota bacterium]|nr:DUF1905 domain-containing protein [Bacillota bacterium]HOG52557.1 YdeI/OmpD-associated family protein [Bacillota bacterium]
MIKEFDALLMKVEGIDGAYIEPPFDVEKEFGANRIKVRALLDGAEYRGSIVRMGGVHILGIPKAIRDAIGKGPGDVVHVLLEKDNQQRSVQLPVELSDAFSRAPGAESLFDALSFTRRKRLADWVLGAAKRETRQKRADKAVQMLLDGRALK